MAEATYGRERSDSSSRFSVDALVAWVTANPQTVILLILMLIAAVLRIYGVGDKALHHDESLHAQFTYQLYNGDGYFHDPLMHGPFLFHAGAAVFFLFGDTDFTGRLLPALFGTALVGMPYFLRNKIGWTAVLIAAVLITLSPTLMYVSRFFRHDPYVIVWFFAMVICIWRYLDERRPVYLYLFGLFLGLSFATMEITYIYAAILLVYVNIMLALELGKPREGEFAVVDPVGRTMIIAPYGLAAALLVADLALGIGLHKEIGVVALLAVLPALTGILVLWLSSARDSAEEGRDPIVWAIGYAPFAWLIAAVWPLLGKRPLGLDRLPPIGDVMIILGTLSATQFGPAVETLPFIGDRGYDVPSEEPLRNITLIILLTGGAYVGLLWRPKVFAITAACFFIPYILLFTTFFTNMDGFFSGIWGSLDYWLAQQDVARGGQPKYYYALLSPLYEFLPLLIVLPGMIWMAVKGDSLIRFLLFWLVGIFVGLSIAGEKMPWLEVHIALPLALCAAVILGRVVDSLDMTPKHWLTAAAVAAGCAAATLLLVEGGSGLVFLGGLLIAAISIGWAVSSFMSEGSRGLKRALITVAFGVLLTLTVRASYNVSFVNYDTPVELLVYTQSSPEIPALMDRIDNLARESGLGYNLPVVVDQTEGYAWPWAWYLRNYNEVSYVNGLEGVTVREGSVLLVFAANASQVDGVGYTQVPFKHRWWFEEDYRGLTVGKVIDELTSIDRLKYLGDFFLYRRPIEGNTGSTDSVAFFPESLAAFDTARPVQPPPEPSSLPDGRLIFGRTGSGPGELLQAADIAVDPSGNIWVADARNNRLHKFDAQGRYISSLGRGGGGPGEFNQPWALTFDAQGFLYVADTWNHRVQKFSPELEFITMWGQPESEPEPGPFNLYGPRDIVIDVDGSIWITDTGHKRIINYSPDGAALGAIGNEGSGLGQFSEPVGLAVDSTGRLLVADTWNSRIQAIVDAGNIVSIPAGWNSQAISDKPYLAVLTDGRIIASDPARSILTLYSPQGAQLGTWTPVPGGLPLGLAATSDGGFVFSDSRRNEVQIVPASAIASLFR